MEALITSNDALITSNEALITSNDAEPPGSRRTGVIGALVCFVPPKTV